MVSRQKIDQGEPSLSLLEGKRIFGAMVGGNLTMDPKEVQKMKKTCEDNGIAVWLNDGCFLEVNPCLVPVQSQRIVQRVGHLHEVNLVPLLFRVHCRWHPEEWRDLHDRHNLPVPFDDLYSPAKYAGCLADKLRSKA